MNGALFASMLKTNGRAITSYAFGSALYLLLIIAIYPSITKADGFNEILKQMPEGVMRAFGFQGGVQELNSFLSVEFYGIIFVLILMIYCVVTGTGLIARLVDRGSMAYLLATPVSRVRVALTQAAVLLFGLMVIALITVGAGFLWAWLFLKSDTLDVTTFLQINLVGFLMFFVISGYTFLFSCLFNDEKRALAISGGLSALFYITDFAAKISDKLDWLKHWTLFAAYQPSAIAKGTFHVLPASIGLAIGGVILYVLGILIFKKRDLPL